MEISGSRLGFMIWENFLSELLNDASKGRRRVMIDIHCTLHIFLYFPVFSSLKIYNLCYSQRRNQIHAIMVKRKEN